MRSFCLIIAVCVLGSVIKEKAYQKYCRLHLAADSSAGLVNCTTETNPLIFISYESFAHQVALMLKYLYIEHGDVGDILKVYRRTEAYVVQIIVGSPLNRHSRDFSAEIGLSDRWY